MVRYRAKFTQRLCAPGRHDLIGAGPNRQQEALRFVFLERPSQHGGDAANHSAGLLLSFFLGGWSPRGWRA
jgi:hypothetical protein